MPTSETNYQTKSWNSGKHSTQHIPRLHMHNGAFSSWPSSQLILYKYTCWQHFFFRLKCWNNAVLLRHQDWSRLPTRNWFPWIPFSLMNVVVITCITRDKRWNRRGRKAITSVPWHCSTLAYFARWKTGDYTEKWKYACGKMRYEGNFVPQTGCSSCGNPWG